MTQQNKPILRFKNFSDDWEQREVSEITLFHKQGYYTKEPYDESKKYYLLRGTEMTSNKIILKDTPKINATEKDYQDFKVQKGDFLIVRSGTVGTYGIVYDDIKAIFGSYLINFRFNTEIVTNEFFGLFYQSQKFRYQLNKIIQQSSNVNINAENIKSTVIDFPEIEEQQKIGAFFKSLDDTIALHQRKLELLKEQKTGFLQKMFPKNGSNVPEIRFSGFTEDWEQRKLGDVSPLRGGYAFQSEKFRSQGVPIIRISNILSDGNIGGNYAFYDEQETDDKYSLPDGAALLAMSGATTGKVAILSNPDNTKFYQNQRVGYFSDLKIVNYDFVSTIVKSNLFISQLSSVLVAGAQPNVSSKEIDSFGFYFPKTLKEQTKLGIFFKQLDDTIALHQKQLEVLKETKKSLLQKMFV